MPVDHCPSTAVRGQPLTRTTMTPLRSQDSSRGHSVPSPLADDVFSYCCESDGPLRERLAGHSTEFIGVSSQRVPEVPTELVGDVGPVDLGRQ